MYCSLLDSDPSYYGSLLVVNHRSLMVEGCANLMGLAGIELTSVCCSCLLYYHSTIPMTFDIISAVGLL